MVSCQIHGKRTSNSLIMTAQEKITDYIAGLSDWRGERLAELRILINASEPILEEEWKWGVPVWSLNGQVCAISAFKDHVKINFFKGASLPDPHKVFNSGLESKNHRSINIGKDDDLNTVAITEFIHASCALNSK
jgi:hypothetical protein